MAKKKKPKEEPRDELDFDLYGEMDLYETDDYSHAHNNSARLRYDGSAHHFSLAFIL